MNFENISRAEKSNVFEDRPKLCLVVALQYLAGRRVWDDQKHSEVFVIAVHKSTWGEVGALSKNSKIYLDLKDIRRLENIEYEFDQKLKCDGLCSAFAAWNGFAILQKNFVLGIESVSWD